MRLLLLIGAVSAALAAAGCGGGGGGSTTAPVTTTTQGKVSQSDSTTIGRGQGSTAEPNAHHTYSGAPHTGAKAPAPGVPVYKGGDNSIQTWGVEASAAQRAQVTSIVHAFLAARAAAAWSKACSYLAAEQVHMFEQLARGKSCAEAMGALAQGVPARAFADEAKISRVLSLRVGKGHAFLIYTRPGGKAYATALSLQGGGWKVFSVGPTALGS